MRRAEARLGRGAAALVPGALGLVPVAGVLAPQGLQILLVVVAGAILATQGPRALGDSRTRATALGIAVMLGWALVSCLWTPEPGSAVRRLGLLAFEAAAGLIAIAGLQAIGREAWDRCCRLLVGGILVALAVLAVEMATGGAIQAALASRRPNLLEAYNRGSTLLAIVLWPAVAWLAMRGRRGQFAGAALVAATAGVLAGLEGRAAQLALAVGAAAYLATCWRPRLFVPLLVAGVATGVAAMPILVSLLPTAQQAASDGLPLGPSALHRLVIWDFATARIVERPAFGWGFDAARHLDSPVQPVEVEVPAAAGRPAVSHEFPSRLPLHPHNMALQIWLELGLIGLLGFGLALAPGLGALTASAGLHPAAQAALLAAAVTVGALAYGAWQGWWVAALWLAAALAAAASARPAQQGAETS